MTEAGGSSIKDCTRTSSTGQNRCQIQALDVGISDSLETQNEAVGNCNIKYSEEVCEFGRDNEAKISSKMETSSST